VLLYAPRFQPDLADQLFQQYLSQGAGFPAQRAPLMGSVMPRDQVVVKLEDSDDMPNYFYSGYEVPTRVATPLERQVAAAVRQEYERRLGHAFPLNHFLLNRYRHGQDSVDWHDDDDKKRKSRQVRFLDHTKGIASLSLGQSRVFQVRLKSWRSAEGAARWSGDLDHGDLVFMKPGMQSTHDHKVPKTRASDRQGVRYNLTFRVYQKV